MNQDEVKHVAAYKNLTKVIQSAADATYPELKLTAVRELNTLLSLESPPIDELIQNGILPILVDCLKESSHVNLQVEAAWALTNMTSGNSEQTTDLHSLRGIHLSPFFLYFVDFTLSPNRVDKTVALAPNAALSFGWDCVL